MTATGRFQHSITLTGEVEQMLIKLREKGWTIAKLFNEKVKEEFVIISAEK
jgi:hypothetical protein